MKCRAEIESFVSSYSQTFYIQVTVDKCCTEICYDESVHVKLNVRERKQMTVFTRLNL